MHTYINHSMIQPYNQSNFAYIQVKTNVFVTYTLDTYVIECFLKKLMPSCAKGALKNR